jgi:hypothetical protein
MFETGPPVLQALLISLNSNRDEMENFNRTTLNQLLADTGFCS